MIESNLEGIRSHIERDFSTEMKERIKAFHLRGGIDYSNIGLIHKSMMMMLRKSLEKNLSTIAPRKTLKYSNYREKVDFTDIKILEPVLSYLKKLEAQ